MEKDDNLIDSKETSREEARELLANLLENGFSGDTEKLAVALGRSTGEIENILSGGENTDEDLLMKIRGIAEERNIEIV